MGFVMEARRLDIAAFSQRRRHYRKKFVRVHKTFRETELFNIMRGYQLPFVLQRDNFIVNHFNNDLCTSVWPASTVLNIPQENITLTLRRRYGMHPFTDTQFDRKHLPVIL